MPLCALRHRQEQPAMAARRALSGHHATGILGHAQAYALAPVGWRYSDPHPIIYDAVRYRNAGDQTRRDFDAHGADHRAPPAGDSTSRRTTLSGDELAHVLRRADAAARKDRRARQAVRWFR